MDSTQKPQSLATYDNQRHSQFDSMAVSNNLNTSLANQPHGQVDGLELEQRLHAPSTHPYPSNFATASNLHMTDNSTSSLSTQHHQYHYIQYPPYYYYIGMHSQRQQQQQHQESLLHGPQLTGMPEVACHCHCSCGAQQQQQQLLSQRQYQQRNFSASTTAIGQAQREEDSSKIVVQVHCQSNGETDCERERSTLPPTKAQSEQSLLNHSYQALQLQSTAEEKPLNVECNSKLNISCDCDLECTCGAERLRSAAAEPDARHSKSAAADMDADVLDTPSPLKNQKQCQLEAMLGADEITVSESDNNSTMIKKKKKTGGGCAHINNEINSWCNMHEQNSPLAADKNCDCDYNSSQIEIYSDGESKGGRDSIDDQRPPLPPRPPPPPRLRNATITGNGGHRHGPGIKKYVVWCLICGGFSCLLGILFLGVYFLLHSYTITVGNFETVPTFVPATLLILTGICIMSLARRRNRYSYLIKLSGVCGLISALTCALVTVTTTVLHMSRLQALRECEYAQKTRTCTCYSDMIESQVDRVDKEGVRLVFDSLSDCGVVHGSLYSCLRAIFGLSVAGVLVAVFSCMLVYQLLSHERKKMYWEQLELRCRSLYTSQQGPPPNMAAMGGGRGPICRCCEQCHLHRQAPLQATAYPWDDSGEPRFWTGQPPGNFYSPNPGGDDLHMANAGTACRGHSGASGARSRMTGWSWPRMPWQRNSPVSNARQFRQTPSSPDSQYGFTNNAPTVAENMMTDADATPAVAHNSAAPPFNVVGGALPYGVWGPPPPYSDPNSPARRGYYQYIEPNPCSNNIATTNNITHSSGNISNENNVSAAAEQRIPCLNHRSVFLEQQPHQLNNNGSNCCPTASMRRNLAKRRTTGGGASSGGSGGEDALKSKTCGGDYENTPSESDGCNMRDRFSNTLPTRKVKKRNETNLKANVIGSANPQPAPRLSMQQVIANTDANCTNATTESTLDGDECMDQINDGMCDEDINTGSCASSRITARATLRRKRGIENTGFQSNSESGIATKPIAGGDSDAVVIAADMHGAGDPTESEVYFADVSSCCNMSLKNDSYYDEAHQTQHHLGSQHHHQHQNSNCSQNSSSNNEDYLAQRFGQRENSIRSRLPFPQTRNNDYEENLNTSHQKEIGGSVTPVNQMHKEISRQSMCSVESEAQTDCTDLSPATPCSNKFGQTSFEGKITTIIDSNETAVPQRTTGGALPNFVAKFPYSSESQSLEAHRRSTKDIHDLILSSEAHYEVINDNPQPTPPCQFTAQQPNTRISKPQPQRPTNLSANKTKTKHSLKTRDRIEANVLQNERDWPIVSGVGNANKGAGVGGGGCGNSERKCL
ncbi:uncharacterized protein LOC128861611 isoform X1 [Anastrepha ludens]|uniref:uncharacterized protein LOC128861611 isoform X1 n=1 Tax=Anastrepha ludens TaxID=28586 RepID=UPI0023AEF0BA|nr:uncharacterized protein LOC128861611 isoform X1 [Anastrepha ludens]